MGGMRLPSICKSGDLETLDLEDDLTDEISVNLDEVDNTKPRTYPIYLQVSDSDNNTIYATCYVTVAISPARIGGMGSNRHYRQQV